MKHTIRIHKGCIETRHGSDFAFIVDDPLSPLNREKAAKILMDELNYEDEDDLEEDDEEYEDEDYENRKGSCEDGWAYFDYWGYEDVEIPESIVERILKGE